MLRYSTGVASGEVPAGLLIATSREQSVEPQTAVASAPTPSFSEDYPQLPAAPPALYDKGSVRALLQQMGEIVTQPRTVAELRQLFMEIFGYDPWDSDQTWGDFMNCFKGYFHVFDESDAHKFGMQSAGMAPLDWNLKASAAAKSHKPPASAEIKCDNSAPHSAPQPRSLSR